MNYKNGILACFFLCFAWNSSVLVAQNCQNDSTGLIPISDLGPNIWNGFSGGLYGGGNNHMPETHKQAGLASASEIFPRNAAGDYDPNGRVGFISMGMSNCNMFFAGLRDSTINFPERNNRLVMVNGATGGFDIDAMLDTNSAYWSTFSQKMAQSNLHDNQVQVIWFMQAKHISGIPSGEGIEHIDIMEEKFLQAFQYFKMRFPNLKQIYCSGRDYGGYSNPGSGNPEPYAYYTGWSFRKLVDRQIAGDLALSYTGESPNTAWLAWADYVWADGINLRDDGFNWICPEDVQNDGVHPSNIGKGKVASLLFNFFKNDTCTYWYRMNTFLNFESLNSDINVHDLYPNPTSKHITVTLGDKYLIQIEILDLHGRIVQKATTNMLDISALKNGTYHVVITTTSGIERKRLIVAK